MFINKIFIKQKELIEDHRFILFKNTVWCRYLRFIICGSVDDAGTQLVECFMNLI